MVTSVSRELNLVRESVPMVPDAVPLPRWLRSHYYPLLFQEAADRRRPAMHPPSPPVRARSGVDLLLNVILCCRFSQMLNGRERVILLCVCVCVCCCAFALLCLTDQTQPHRMIMTKPGSPELICQSGNITVVSVCGGKHSASEEILIWPFVFSSLCVLYACSAVVLRLVFLLDGTVGRVPVWFCRRTVVFTGVILRGGVTHHALINYASLAMHCICKMSPVACR